MASIHKVKEELKCYHRFQFDMNIICVDMNVQDDSSTIFVDYRICFTEQNVTFFFSFSEIVKAVYWLKFVEFLKKEKNYWKNQQPKAVKRLVKYEN